MELKIRKGKAADIFKATPPFLPMPLWDVDKNTLLYLQKLAKKSEGALRVTNLPIVFLASNPVKKRTTRNYDVWKF